MAVAFVFAIAVVFVFGPRRIRMCKIDGITDGFKLPKSYIVHYS